MIKSLILLSVRSEEENDFVLQLHKIEGITSIKKVSGTYDFLVELEAETKDKTRGIITWKIRKLPGIISTITLLKKPETETKVVKQPMKIKMTKSHKRDTGY